METSNKHLMQENQMLTQGAGAFPLGDLLDLESPVQKVLNMLRQMQLDSSLLEWQAAIETAIHKLSRAKLHDLFLPSAMHMPSALSGSTQHAETEMVEQILGEITHHDDQDEVAVGAKTPRMSDSKLDDGVLVEERRKEVLKEMSKARFFAGASKVRGALLLGRGGSKATGMVASGGAGDNSEPSSPSKGGTPKGLSLSSLSVPEESADGGESFTTAALAWGTGSPNGSPTRELANGPLRLLQENINSWGCGEQTIFGLHDAFGPDMMFFLFEAMLRELDLFEHFAIDAKKVQSLCNDITAGYNDHPYHNYIHGCDVLHGEWDEGGLDPLRALADAFVAGYHLCCGCLCC